MAETGLKLRSGWREFLTTAPVGGCIAGAMDKIQDTVGVYMQTADAGEDVVFCYHAEKIRVPKYAAAGYVIVQGEKVYYNPFRKDVVADTTSGNTLCGRCLVAAGALDTTVLIDFCGNVAA